MKKLCYALLMLGASALTTSVVAKDIELGMVTGSETGTYYQFGQDMSKLVAEHGINLQAVPSRGSIENMLAIYDSRSVHLGIAQSDVTLFMKLLGDEKTREIAREIKVVFPLYDEEVHLLAGDGVKQLADLKDKKVAIGKPGSGTAMTANLMFEVTKIQPAEKLSLGQQEAIDALRKGEIDAMFSVIGYPASLFQKEISSADKLHLVPLTEKEVIEMFGATVTIPASTYPWQDSEVQTISVKAGLMTLDFPSDNVNCSNVGRFAKTIYDNIDWLKENGHEKWKSVNLDEPVHPSLQSPCAVQALKQ